MLDTIRLVGSSIGSNIKTNVTKYTSYIRENGVEKIAGVSMNDLKGYPYRAWIDPNHLTLTVELNPHKILFGENIYNYCSNASAVRNLVYSVADTFFAGNDCFISRADLGGIQTFGSPTQAMEALEQYRNTKISGARIKKYRHQNYQHTVCYYTQNWSAKIYNKGYEVLRGSEQQPGVYPFDLYSSLRFEKTYRSGEFERLGMPKKPYRGVHLHQFDFGLWYTDFMDFFSKWEREKKAYYTDMKGVAGLLNVIDQMGQLSNVEAMGIVDRTTIWRYRKAKRDNIPVEPVKFVDNLTSKQKNTVMLLNVGGFSPYLQHAIKKFQMEQKLKFTKGLKAA